MYLFEIYLTSRIGLDNLQYFESSRLNGEHDVLDMLLFFKYDHMEKKLWWSKDLKRTKLCSQTHLGLNLSLPPTNVV